MIGKVREKLIKSRHKIRKSMKILVICKDCGKTEELEVNSFSKLLSNLKTKANFQFQKFQMEVSSTCKGCN